MCPDPCMRPFSFFDSVKKMYEECQIGPNSAALIFNADESGFCTDPTKVKGIGERGQTLNRIVQGSGKEYHTVLACVSASGDVLPPLIVFKGLSVLQTWISSDEYPGTMYYATSNGWMGEPTFFYVKNVCSTCETNKDYPWPGRAHSDFFFDGHASHISIRIIQLALAHNIKLVKITSHVTDKIQPLDVSGFSPIKRTWDEYSNTWKKIISKTILNVFSHTGLFPFDRERVKDDWFCPVGIGAVQTTCKSKD